MVKDLPDDYIYPVDSSHSDVDLRSSSSRLGKVSEPTLPSLSASVRNDKHDVII